MVQQAHKLMYVRVLVFMVFALTVSCSLEKVAIDPTATIVIPNGWPAAWPFIYSGKILADGVPVPEGYTVVGRIDDFESDPIVIKESKYWALTVGSVHSRHFDRPITFHLISPDGKEVAAEQSEQFVQYPRPTEFRNFLLVFSKLP